MVPAQSGRLTQKPAGVCCKHKHKRNAKEGLYLAQSLVKVTTIRKGEHWINFDQDGEFYETIAELNGYMEEP